MQFFDKGAIGDPIVGGPIVNAPPGGGPVQGFKVSQHVVRDFLHDFGVPVHVPELRRISPPPTRIVACRARKVPRSGSSPSRSQPRNQRIQGLLSPLMQQEPPAAKTDYGGCGYGDLEDQRVHKYFPGRIVFSF
jgi:hypothetical protein